MILQQQEDKKSSPIHIPNFYQKPRQKKQFTHRKNMHELFFKTARKQISSSNREDQFNQQVQKWLSKKQGLIPPTFSDWVIAQSFSIKQYIFNYLQMQVQICNRENIRFIRQTSTTSCIRPYVFISRFNSFLNQNSMLKFEALKTSFKQGKDDHLVVQIFMLFSCYLQISIKKQQTIEPQHLILAFSVFESFRHLIMARDPMNGLSIVNYIYYLVQNNKKTTIVQIRNQLLKIIFQFIRLRRPQLSIIKSIRIFLDDYFEQVLPLFIGNPFFIDYILNSFQSNWQKRNSFLVLNTILKIPENSNFSQQKKKKVIQIVGHQLQSIIDEQDIEPGLACLSTISNNPQLSIQQHLLGYNFARMLENSRTTKRNLVSLMKIMNQIISFYPSNLLHDKIVNESGYIQILIDRIGYYSQEEEQLIQFTEILQELVDIVYERFKDFNGQLNKNTVCQLLHITKLCSVSQNCWSKLAEFQSEIFVIGDQFPEETQ